MIKFTKYIYFIINFLLMVFVVTISGAIFSLGDRGPEFLRIMFFPAILLEYIYYSLIIYFVYLGKRFVKDRFVNYLIAFVLMRLFLAVSSGIVFRMVQEEVDFLQGFWAAMYGNTLIYMIQILSVPFLAYPFIFTYTRITRIRRISERYAMSEKLKGNIINTEELKYISLPISTGLKLTGTVSVSDKPEIPDWIVLPSIVRDRIYKAIEGKHISEIVGVEQVGEAEIVAEEKPLAAVEEKGIEAGATEASEAKPFTGEVEMVELAEGEKVSEKPEEVVEAKEEKGPEEIEVLEIFPEREAKAEIPEAFEFEKMEETGEEEVEYTINSLDDKVSISIRELIELNTPSEAASALDSLIKRGSDFTIQVPLRDILDSLKTGSVKFNVEKIYDEVPIEIVNFVTRRQVTDLGKYELTMPAEKIIKRINPELRKELGLTGEIAHEVPSKVISIDSVLSDIESEANTLNYRFKYEYIDDVLFIILVSNELDIENVEEVYNLVSWMTRIDIPELGKRFKLLLTTSSVDVACLCRVPMRTNLDCIVMLSPIAADKLSIFTDMEKVSQRIPEFADVQNLSRNVFETIEISDIKEASDIGGYSGFWVNVPGKTIAVISEKDSSMDNICKLATIGDKLTEIISGLGKEFSIWRFLFIFSTDWSLGACAVPGGVLVFEPALGIGDEKLIDEVKRLFELFNPQR
ncbi:hypothetical protein J7J62_04715 [bacterium]|nr:hypothetical protein [bacterium]